MEKKYIQNKAKFKQSLSSNPALRNNLKRNHQLVKFTTSNKPQEINSLRLTNQRGKHTHIHSHKTQIQSNTYQQTLLIGNSQHQCPQFPSKMIQTKRMDEKKQNSSFCCILETHLNIKNEFTSE